MKHRLIIEGNAVYEIDEDCVKKKREEWERRKEGKRLACGRGMERKSSSSCSRQK